MKKLPVIMLVLFAFCLLAACKNPWVTELLKAPSELSALEVTAYVEDLALQGGASFEPGFTPSKRKYTVYVPLETTRFIVNPVFDGNGTVTWETEGMDEAADTKKLEFNFYGDEVTLEVVLTVERENMLPGEYRLTVTRTDNLPPPKVLGISVTPSVGTYFLGGGVNPVVSVQVEEPADGGELSFQWFRNEEDNNVTGSIIIGATRSGYILTGAELTQARTMYYYVEITKNLDGKTSKLESATRSVTFFDRGEVLDEKSGKDNTYGNDTSYWVNVPAGTANNSSYWVSADDIAGYFTPWSTEGYLMAKYPVTYELWELVRSAAEKENYKFANAGNQGAVWVTSDPEYPFRTLNDPRPVGNKLHPVTLVGWRDVIVWCNAYSEMCGLAAVYCDNKGNVLRDARQPVEWLIDDSRMAGKKGYRLPILPEQEYAARGADPDNAVWQAPYIGSPGNKDDYMWNPPWDDSKTDEVGGNGSTQRLPNSIGLYDIVGNVLEWCYLNHDLYLYDEVLSNYLNNTYGRSLSMLAGAFDGGSMGSATTPDMSIDEHEAPRYRWYTDITENKGFRIIRYK